MASHLEILSKFLMVLALIISLIVISMLVRNRELFDNLKNKARDFFVDYKNFVEPRNDGYSGPLQDPLDLSLFQTPTCSVIGVGEELQSKYYLNPNNQLLPSAPNCLVVNTP